MKLNPNLKKVASEEVFKLLDANIIYLISYNNWISPVHVVPKKGRMTVVENDKNELIPTRLVIRCRVEKYLQAYKSSNKIVLSKRICQT